VTLNLQLLEAKTDEVNKEMPSQTDCVSKLIFISALVYFLNVAFLLFILVPQRVRAVLTLNEPNEIVYNLLK
jgi:hypothetical protein